MHAQQGVLGGSALGYRPMPTSSTGSGWLELKVCVPVVSFIINLPRLACMHDHARAQVAGQAGIPTWKRVWIELKYDIRCVKKSVVMFSC
jgi:hypothetical protein